MVAYSDPSTLIDFIIIIGGVLCASRLFGGVGDGTLGREHEFDLLPADNLGGRLGGERDRLVLALKYVDCRAASTGNLRLDDSAAGLFACRNGIGESTLPVSGIGARDKQYAPDTLAVPALSTCAAMFANENFPTFFPKSDEKNNGDSCWLGRRIERSANPRKTESGGLKETGPN
ncbi:hypothetical protein C8R46DRAFT_1227646 [Mycena filopes]|nr:hypothetical protein C8R46DRAFT_1227646 [Mycena filopes]